MTKNDLARMIIFGDSLSDSGNLDERRLFGLFPIPGTGLDKSGDGRFADGLVWPDFLALYWADKIFNQAVPNEALRKKLWEAFVNGLIKPENEVDILQHHLIRNYAEGGSTAATYKILNSLGEDIEKGIEDLSRDSLEGILKDVEYSVENPKALLSSLTDSVKKLGAQGIVINLAIQRHQFLQNEAKLLKGKSADDVKQLKDETLITVWAGANDLITVNKTPTIDEADKAINAIIDHIQTLQNHGYSQFAILNLPDLTKTPFYQKALDKGEIKSADIKEIQKVIQYYNSRLESECAKLQSKPNVFDVYTQFNEVYDNPQKYGFDPNLLKKPLSDDPNWKPTPGIAPAEDTGAMFWNDVHPSSKMQAIICQKFLEKLQDIYSLDNHLDAVTKVAKQMDQGVVSRFFSFLWANVSQIFVTLWHGIKGLFTSAKSQSPSVSTPTSNEPPLSSFASMLSRPDFVKIVTNDTDISPNTTHSPSPSPAPTPRVEPANTESEQTPSSLLYF
jgi:phospholipase/lecithinase/hemolysin